MINKRTVTQIIFSFLFFISSFAHSGRTDSDGGHFDHATGEYHSHNNIGTIIIVLIIVIVLVVIVNIGNKNNKK